jgi:hypothetical protein
VRGQDEAPDARVHRPDVPAHVDAAAVGQPRVEHGHVRPQLEDPALALARRAGLPHHVDAGVFQQVSDTPSDQFMVIKEERPNVRH